MALLNAVDMASRSAPMADEAKKEEPETRAKRRRKAMYDHAERVEMMRRQQTVEGKE